MKTILTLITICVLLISCTREEEQAIAPAQNKVLLLQIDYETSVFEAGTELTLNSTAPFTVNSSYQAPGDFGGIRLYYDTTNQPIFEGSIVWMGLGARSYPSQLQAASTFTQNATALPQPNASLFEKIDYDEFAYYPQTIDYAALWQAIDSLAIVAAYRVSNPNSSIHLYLYTPSVGDGNAADWDWYIILKN